MKNNIHPTTHQTTVSCACGASFETLSTLEKITTEVCSKCHPFFTGEQKFVDSAQRLKKFEEKEQKRAALQGSKNVYLNKKEKKAARESKKGGKSVMAKTDAKKALKDAKKALADL